MRKQKNILIILLLLVTITVYANMAELIYTHPGNLTGEFPAVEGISIIEENLILDFRPLEQKELFNVEATYTLFCDKDEAYLKLVFVANQLDGDNFIILLDNISIFAERIDGLELPESWTPPQNTPGFNYNKGIPYYTEDEGLIEFDLLLTHGQHTIKVSYLAKASVNSFDDSLVKIWQHAYILSPAKNWQSFNQLNAKILFPEGWEISTNLNEFKRENNTLTGSWNIIPADYIAVSLKTPSVIPIILLNLILIPGCILFAGICLLILNTIINRRIKKSKPGYETYFIVFFLSIIIFIFFYFIYFSEPEIFNWLLNNQLNWNYDRGRVYTIFLAPVVFLLALLMTSVASLIMRKYKEWRINREPPVKQMNVGQHL